MINTIWYKGLNDGMYTQEELKLMWFEKHPKEKFELCNFIAWLDQNYFVRVN